MKIKLNKINSTIKKKLTRSKHQRNLVSYLRSGKHHAIDRRRMNVQVQTVSTCNAKCHFCPYVESWHKTNPGTMPDELYQNIIDSISRYKIDKFCPYLENEPLVDKKLFGRIEYALSKTDICMLELSTNASLVNSTIIDNVVRLFSGVPHELWISFHGVDKESYESIMGLDFDKSLQNVLALLDKAQLNDLNIKIRGSGTPRISSPKMKTWFGENDYLKFWNKQFEKCKFRKKPQINFFTYHDRAGSINRNEVNFTEYINRDLERFYCNRLDSWLHFLYTGELILCCMDYHKETVFGNISNESLEEILSGKTYLDLLRKATGLVSSAPDFICKKCISPGG